MNRLGGLLVEKIFRSGGRMGESSGWGLCAMGALCFLLTTQATTAQPLAGAVRVTGSVVDEDGVAMAGASVLIQEQSGQLPQQKLTTHASGAFLLGVRHESGESTILFFCGMSPCVCSTLGLKEPQSCFPSPWNPSSSNGPVSPIRLPRWVTFVLVQLPPPPAGVASPIATAINPMIRGMAPIPA